MKKILRIILTLLAIIMTPSLVIADDASLKNYIRSNPELIEENVFIYEGEKSNFIVSIGVAEIKGNTPEDKLNAMKVAEMVAQSEIMKYLNGVFSESEKEFKEVTVFKDGNSYSEADVSQSFSEILRERGEGIIRNVKKIDRWKSEDKTEYFVAIGLEVEK